MSTPDATCTNCRERKPTRRGLCRVCYQRWRTHGEFDPILVDVDPVRQHVHVLLAARFTPAAISSASGVKLRRIRHIINGTTDRETGAPQTRIHRRTATAILAIPTDVVPSLGAIRRVQALVTLGHPMFELAHRIRIAERELSDLATKTPPIVTAELDAAIRGLYNVLYTVPGPNDDARRYGLRAGWAAPFAWDNIAALDDPAAVPDGVPPRPRRAIPPDFAEIVDDHRSIGHTDEQIAAHFDISIEALQRRYQRLGIDPQSVAS